MWTLVSSGVRTAWTRIFEANGFKFLGPWCLTGTLGLPLEETIEDIRVDPSVFRCENCVDPDFEANGFKFLGPCAVF